jgi:hypothetical protein
VSLQIAILKVLVSNPSGDKCIEFRRVHSEHQRLRLNRPVEAANQRARSHQGFSRIVFQPPQRKSLGELETCGPNLAALTGYSGDGLTARQPCSATIRITIR